MTHYPFNHLQYDWVVIAIVGAKISAIGGAITLAKLR